MGYIKYIFIAFCFLSFFSCNRLGFAEFFPSWSKTVDHRFEESMQMQVSPNEISLPSADAYRFYVCGDSHYETTARKFTEMLTACSLDTMCQFVFHVGDLVDYKEQYVEINSLIEDNLNPRIPFFAALGNHDIYFDQWGEFKDYFGASVYAFVLRTRSCSDFFICLDSASGTLGVKQKRWLEQLLESERSKHRNCVVFTHTNIWNTDNSQLASGNFSMDETLYFSDLLSRHKVNLCISGHDHYREILTYKGVQYITLDCIKDEADNSSYISISSASVNSDLNISWIECE